MPAGPPPTTTQPVRSLIAPPDRAAMDALVVRRRAGLHPVRGAVKEPVRSHLARVEDLGRCVGEPLEEQVVAPLAGDEQVARRPADQGEPGTAQHRLGGVVVDERAGLEAVQAVAREALAEHLEDGGGGHAAAGPVGGDPVAQRAAAEGAAGDVGDGDAPAGEPSTSIR